MKMKEERQMTKKIAGGFGSLVIALFLCGKASAYCHANAFGGGTAHTYGHTYHSNAYGGSTSHTYGEGTSHTNAYGGSTSHSYNGGTSHTNAYGGSTSGAYGAGAVHTTPYIRVRGATPISVSVARALAVSVRRTPTIRIAVVCVPISVRGAASKGVSVAIS